MNIQISHIIFLAGCFIYLIIRCIYMYRGASDKKSVNKSSVSDNLLIFFVGTAQTGLPLIFIFTPWLNWANYTLPDMTIWVGTPVIAGALYLFWRSHSDLGNQWSVTLELNHDHKLVSDGVYRYIRHPMYSSFFLLGISQALLLNNWIAGWAALTAMTFLYIFRIPHEEAMMLELFDDQYTAYMEQTGRIIPRITKKLRD